MAATSITEEQSVHKLGQDEQDKEQKQDQR